MLCPKEPFARWVGDFVRNQNRARNQDPEFVKHFGKTSGAPSLAGLRADSTAYLIDLPVDLEQTAKEYVEHDHVFFFKRELEQWQHDPSTWPQSLTLELFRQWFDIEALNMVLDIGKG